MILIGISILLIIIGRYIMKNFGNNGAFGFVSLLLGIIGLAIFSLMYPIQRAKCGNAIVLRASLEQSIKDSRENTNFIEQAALSQTIIGFNSSLAVGQRYANMYLLKDFYTDEYRQLKPLK